MEDDGVDDRVFGRGFVDIDSDVDPLFPDELHDPEGDLFSEESIGPPWIAAVQVPHFIAGKSLSGGIDVDCGIGPLVDRIGQAGAQAEQPLAQSSGYGETLRVPFLRVAVGEPAGVGARDDEETASLRPDILDEEDSGDHSGGLIGMGPSQHQRVPSLFSSLEDVHFRIAMGVLERREIIAQPMLGGQSRARIDRLGSMHGLEAPAGKKAEDPGHDEGKNGRARGTLDSLHRSLDQEEPEEKEGQDDSGPRLVPKFPLAEEMPEEMEA